MLDGLSTLGTLAALAAGIVFALWTFFICKLIFLGRPRHVALRAFGVEIKVAPPDCPTCAVRGVDELRN